MGDFRTYRELSLRHTFEDRFDYLSLNGVVAHETFGHDRAVNQDFYRSREWKLVRNEVIVRDEGCDLGIPGREIHGELVVHHMEPITIDDLIHGEMWVLDPEFLITTTLATHNAIHYGNVASLPRTLVERYPGDTNLW